MAQDNWGLIGHQAAVTTLRNALASGRLAQAYLFTGPQGVGKSMLARTLAGAVNCRGEEPPCGECPQCPRILQGIHSDVTELSLGAGERELSIEAVRELQHSLHLRPFEGRMRVAIIQEAEHLSTEAANALLKVLEEPPPESMLILTSAAEDSILPTLRSRCQRIALDPVPTAPLVRAMEEQHGLNAADARRIAAYAQGCPGRALGALERPEVFEQLEERFQTLRSLLEGDTAARLQLAGSTGPQQESQREALQALLQVWLLWWRDLLLVQNDCQAGIVYVQETLHYQQYGAQLNPSEVALALAALRTALRRVEQNANPRLVMDTLALALPQLSPTPAPANALA